ncbi:cGMP-specific 3',5'-cyclic phosphodiesterase [Thelohanellus kitauei]|uniref:cGMP-specific 3',5'-cyclic phosphodiesterase n=1 Tax=Thelohanellus kitauei TaxID=669202 RepID=A0A0C2IC14_THEKT|nr:cGMP-specific 3',5'-cyclic phosphodiesterase [Thelohanellus kitauei]
MLMTACDISGVSKPWNTQKRIASLVTEEFFQQGDIEKSTLHSTPIDLMDRDKEDQIPQLQVGFIESICLPLYKSLSDLWPELTFLFSQIQKNKEEWERQIYE